MFNRKLPYVIAEVGSNHLGIKKLAEQSIILAKKAVEVLILTSGPV